MLNVKINDQIFNVRWKREKKKRQRKEVIDTHCDISKVDPFKEGRNKYTTMKGAAGKAYQNPKDTFNKAIGRKISLKRALKNYNKHKKYGLKLNKKTRKIFWDVYKQNCKLK